MYETFSDLLKAMTRGFSKDDEFKKKIDEILKKYPIVEIETQDELLKNNNSIYEEIKNIVVKNLFNENHKIKNNNKCINAVSKWSMFDKDYLIKHNFVEM